MALHCGCGSNSTASSILAEKKLLFVGGLHRSGTTPFTRFLGSSSQVSIFCNTGAIEDEGQFLQDVFPVDAKWGGPGRFALDPNAHLTEAAVVSAETTRARLISQWAPYWDLSKSILTEKTPAHIVQSRFLQTLFPEAYFVFLLRHPIPTSLATAKWTGAYVSQLFTHYVHAVRIMSEDLCHLRRARVVYYEHLVSKPAEVAAILSEFLGEPLSCDTSIISSGRSRRYFRAFWSGNYHLKGRPIWKRFAKRLFQAACAPLLAAKYEPSFRKLGYSCFSPEPGVALDPSGRWLRMPV